MLKAQFPLLHGRTLEIYSTPNGYQVNIFDASGWVESTEQFDEYPTDEQLSTNL